MMSCPPPFTLNSCRLVVTRGLWLLPTAVGELQYTVAQCTVCNSQAAAHKGAGRDLGRDYTRLVLLSFQKRVTKGLVIRASFLLLLQAVCIPPGLLDIGI